MDFSKNTACRTISFEALACDGADGRFPDIPLDRIWETTRSCTEEHERGVLSCKINGFEEDFVGEGRGFKLGNKKVRGTTLLLPAYIPTPDKQSTNLPVQLVGHSILGVGLDSVFPRGTYAIDGNTLYRDRPRANLSYAKNPMLQGRRKILFFSGPDVLIEGLNFDKYDIRLYETLASLGFEAITSPDFSVRGGACYPGQIANLNRSLAAGEAIEGCGTPVIPNIYAGDDYQRQIWSEYLNENDSNGIIAINCQLQHTSTEDMRTVIETVVYLIEHVKHSLHIILRGFPFNIQSFTPLLGYMARLHFADSAPFILARNNGYEIFNKSESRLERINHKPKSKGGRARMIESGIRAREEFLAFLSGGSILGIQSSFHSEVTIRRHWDDPRAP